MNTYKVKIPTITFTTNETLTHAQAVKEAAGFILRLRDDDCIIQEITVSEKWRGDRCSHGIRAQDCYDCYPRSGAV